MMILLVLASPLSAVLLFAVLAVARRPTSLLLLLLTLLALLLLLLLLPTLALLLVELGVLSLVLDRGDVVGILGAASVATTKAALFLGGFQGFGIFQRLRIIVPRHVGIRCVDHLLSHH
jgi:hypothetical protein